MIFPVRLVPLFVTSLSQANAGETRYAHCSGIPPNGTHGIASSALTFPALEVTMDRVVSYRKCYGLKTSLFIRRNIQFLGASFSGQVALRNAARWKRARFEAGIYCKALSNCSRAFLGFQFRQYESQGG